MDSQPKSRTFEDVELWKKAHAWVLDVYRFTETFPKHEMFGLTSQLRRAAVSVPGNFAEGFNKSGRADKVRSTISRKALWKSLVTTSSGSRPALRRSSQANARRF